MDMISLEGKTNFFEKRVGEYQKSGVMASLEGKSAESSSSGGVAAKELDFAADFWCRRVHYVGMLGIERRCGYVHNILSFDSTRQFSATVPT